MTWKLLQRIMGANSDKARSCMGWCSSVLLYSQLCHFARLPDSERNSKETLKMSLSFSSLLLSTCFGSALGIQNEETGSLCMQLRALSDDSQTWNETQSCSGRMKPFWRAVRPIESAYLCWIPTARDLSQRNNPGNEQDVDSFRVMVFFLNRIVNDVPDVPADILRHLLHLIKNLALSSFFLFTNIVW